MIKKATSNEIVIDSRQSSTKPKRPRLSKDDKSDLVGTAKRLEAEAKQLVTETRVGGAEANFKSEYDRMLRYNSRLIRRLNTQLETAISARDIYALSTLMSQQREVINDLRSITDLSGQLELINSQSITPFMSDLTQLITDVYYQLRKLLMETTKPKETQFALSQLDGLIKQIGLGMQTNHEMIKQSIESILIGAPNTVKTKKRQRT